MKLLWHMPTLRHTLCGLSIRAVHFAMRLRDLGHDVTFAVARDKTDCDEGDIRGIPVQLLDVTRRRPFHWSIQATERIRAARDAVMQIDGRFDAILTCQPEAVVAFQPRQGGASARSKQQCAPVIFVCGGTTLLHDEADRSRRERATRQLRGIIARPAFAVDRALKRHNEQWAFELADACIFDSESTMARVVDEYGIDRTKCHALRGAVDADACRPPNESERRNARQAYGISDDVFAMAWTGRMSPEKNLVTLLRAMPLVRRADLHLFLAGDGTERPALEKIVSALSDNGNDDRATVADRVHFLGNIADVRSLLHAADVLVFPSVSESLGLSLIEAMACGLPAIALAGDGQRIRNAFREILDDGRCGTLVAHNTPTAFAAAIDDLATDADKRASFAATGRTRAASEFGWNESTRRLQSLITHLICRSTGKATQKRTYAPVD